MLCCEAIQAMAHSEDRSNDDIQFHWGKKRGIGGAKRDYQFYESFTFDNVNYSLYDCVYLFKHNEHEPYIGKILRIWEQSGHKRVKILWFFQPNEIRNYLGDHVPLEKEIFLASGEGVGLFNVNALVNLIHVFCLDNVGVCFTSYPFIIILQLYKIKIININIIDYIQNGKHLTQGE